MPPLLIMTLLVVVAISIFTVARQHKRRKKSRNESISQFGYKRRINIQEPQRRSYEDLEEYITKYNSPIDYREPAGKKADFSEWE
jgi:hypothetical protein